MGLVVAVSKYVLWRLSKVAAAAAAVSILVACASNASTKNVSADPEDARARDFISSTHTPTTLSWREARIVDPSAPLQCVPYARKVSGFPIWGDAWTWWRTAEGRYRRSTTPAVGSILSFKRTKRLRLGHVAVVNRILNDREIVVEHANWLNRGRIHISTPVRDVSPANDWSRVRVWYTPGRRYGSGVYPTRGFILPNLDFEGSQNIVFPLAVDLIPLVASNPEIRITSRLNGEALRRIVRGT